MRDEYSALIAFNLPEESSPSIETYLQELGLNFTGPSFYGEKVRYSIDFDTRMDYWNFVRELKTSSFYVSWDKYKHEEEMLVFANSINNNTIVWDYQQIRRILADESGWWSDRGDFTSWYNLAALLSKNYVILEAKQCPIYSKPDSGTEDFEDYLYSWPSRGNMEIGALNWIMSCWLKEQGESNPKFPSSLANVRADELGISVKVGEGDPSQILNWILGAEQTYIHVPYSNDPYMYIFRTNAKFDAWKSSRAEEREEIYQEASRFLVIEKERLAAEEEKRQNELIESCQLANIQEGALLSNEQIQNICRHDKTSPFREKYFSSEEIRKLIKQGKLLGTKEGNRWYVKKEDLEFFFNLERQ